MYYVNATRPADNSILKNGNKNNGFDDERGDYLINIHDHVNYRFEVISRLGKGSFGQDIKAIDHMRKEFVDLKIIRNKKRFHR